MNKGNKVRYVTNTKIDSLISLIDTLIGTIDSIGKSFEGKSESELGILKLVYLDILKRTVPNLHSICILLGQYKAYNQYKISIFLLLRTCLSDSLLGLYLSTYRMDKNSFENEVNVIDRSYFVAMKKFLKEEPRYKIPVASDTDLTKEFENNFSNLRKGHPEFFKKDKSLKSNKELRSRSKKELFAIKRGEKPDMSYSPTDENFYQRLIKFRALKAYGYIYLLIKFFAQYHHYAFKTRSLIESNREFEFNKIVLSISFLYATTDTFGNLLDLDKKLTAPLKKRIEEFLTFKTNS
ncbi:MAG TPA: hypothetical protein VGA21_02850 [Cyclobacteriaceae bacterium]